jgi:hypothetical protein
MVVLDPTNLGKAVVAPETPNGKCRPRGCVCTSALAACMHARVRVRVLGLRSRVCSAVRCAMAAARCEAPSEPMEFALRKRTTREGIRRGWVGGRRAGWGGGKRACVEGQCIWRFGVMRGVEVGGLGLTGRYSGMGRRVVRSRACKLRPAARPCAARPLGISAGPPEVQRSQGVGAARQVPRDRHHHLRPRQRQLRLSAGADGGIERAAVEGREGRDRLQRVRDGCPAGRIDQVLPAREKRGERE